MQANDYPPPLFEQRGKEVSYYTYNSSVDAMRASVIAESRAMHRWANGQDYVYSLPGQIVRNPDGSFTVTVV